MKNLFSNIIIFIKCVLKPIGFYEFSSQPLSKFESNKIQSCVLKYLHGKNFTKWEEIFKRNYELYLYDKYFLKSLRKSSFFWKFYYLLSKIAKFLYFIFDLIRIIFMFNRRYYLYLNKASDNSQTNRAINFSNNIERAKNKFFFDQKNTLDMFIQNDKIEKKNLISFYKISLSGLFDIIKLKFKFYFVHGHILADTYAGGRLFEHGFAKLDLHKDKDQCFIREGTSPISKIFLYEIGKYKIKRNIIYSNIVLPDSMIFPNDSDSILVTSTASKSVANSYKKNITYLNGNPFINWKKISSYNNNNTVGLLLGDELNRWKEQDSIDIEILEELKILDCKICIGKPHPQELNIPHRLNYYKNLVKKFPFLSLDTGDSQAFLKKVDIVISYAKSTLVEESLLCKKLVIEYRTEPNYSPNKKIIGLAKNLGFSIYSNSNFKDTYLEILSIENSKKDEAWNSFLRVINYKDI